MNELHKQSIEIADLSVGMFVVDLDIPWIKSPFITHSRRIKSFKDIDALKRSGVKQLVIDANRGLAFNKPQTQSEDARQASSKDSQQNPHQHHLQQAAHKTQPIERAELNSEMAAAKKVRHDVNRVVNELFTRLESQAEINVEAVTPLINETLSSLERNNQALMSLIHISRKSHKLADHTFSTYCLALNIGVLKKCSRAELEILGLASLLHEAGWVQLPINLMGKRTRYTANERKLISQHIVIGEKILQASALPELVLRLITEHHERLNGSGYPNQLKGHDIHPLSQILALADSYDERIHQLQDKPGVLPRNAVQALFKEAKAGVFDPALMRLFVAAVGVYPVSSAVALSNGEKGVVVEINAQTHSITVRIFYNKDKKIEPYDLTMSDGAHQAKEETGHGNKIIQLLDPNDSRDDPYGLLVLEH